MPASATELCPQIWQIDSGKDGPTVTVLGGVHGSEVPGIQVVQNLLKSNIQSLVYKGKLNIGIGNPAAVAENARFPKEDFDLNRSFGEVPPQYQNSIAAKRAAELKPVLTETNVLLDIHSTLNPSEPIVLSPNNIRDEMLQKLIQLFGIRKVITGEGLASGTTGVCTDTYVWQNGGLGITLETGWQEDTEVIPRIEKAVTKALEIIGISCLCLDDDIKITETDQYEAYWSVPASDTFEFTKTWANFSLIPKGTHFATDNGEKLITPRSSYIIFQKSSHRLKAEWRRVCC